MLQQVFDALNRRDPAAALAAAESAVQAQPEHPDSHYAHGLALQATGDRAGAGAAFDRAIAYAPDHARAQVARAALAVGEQRFDAAGAALDAAVRSDPNTLGAYVLAAHLALARGDAGEAERQLKLAERVDRDHPGVLTVAGNLAMARGEREQATRFLVRAVERAPEDPLALSSLGLAWLANGNHAFAEQTLQRALELQPDAVRLRWALVEALGKQQRWEDMPAPLQTLLEQAPDHPRALALLGDVELRLGRADAAADAYRRLLALPQLTLRVFDPTVGQLMRIGRSDIAIDALEQRLAAAPDDDGLWQRRMLLATEDPAALDLVLDRWQQALPDSAFMLSARAQRAEFRGDAAAAEAAADRALAAAPGLLAAHTLKLRAELSREPAAALARAEQLVAGVGDADPLTRRQLLFMRGLALDLTGRYADAAADWRACAALAHGEPRPQVEPLPEGFAAIEDTGPLPRLLWGAPGSRVGEVVSLLRTVAGLPVLDDRYGPGPRPDGYGPPRADRALASLPGWRTILQRRELDPDIVVDWLPHWDERIAAALPGRLVAVVADPRDMLLNWIAFGCPQPWTIGPLIDAARWLADALAPVAARAAGNDPHTCVIRNEALVQTPDAVAAALQQFLALPAAPDVAALDAARHGLGGLPTAFAPGHWRKYAEAFAAEFAALHAVAAQLGYPA